MGKKNKKWTETEYQEYLARLGGHQTPTCKYVSSVGTEHTTKYRTGPHRDRTYNGILFGSVKEMKYYKDLQLLIKGGKLRFFLRQVPFELPGGIKYLVDFVEFNSDGTVRFVDVKGVETQVFKNKKKQVEALYPVTIDLE